MKSFSTFIIETSSDGPKKPLGGKDSSSGKNNKSGNKKNKNVGGKKSSGRNVNTRKTNSSNTPTTGKNVVDVVDKSGKNVKVDLDSKKFDNSQQMRDIQGDPQSKNIRKDIERQTNTKTRDYTQKGGVTKGNDSASMNRRLSAGTTKGDQLTKAYGTSGIQGDSNPGPISDFEKKKLRQTASSNKKITVNYAEPPKSGQDKLLDKIFSPKPKKGEKELTKAVVNRPSNKGPVNPRTGSRIPDARKGELGKLYKTSTKSDPKRGGSVRTTDKINQELTAKRAARIDPKTGKATQKGVENFAINKLTKGLSTKGPTGREQLANAKKIAGNARSAAYKDIANKINTSDYAGKRAKLASTKELDQIAKDVKSSSTIGDKPSQTNIKVTKTKTPSIKSINPNLNKIGGPVRSSYGKIKNPKKTFSQFRDTSATKAIKSNAAKLKIKPGGLVGPAFAAWNAIDNYKAAKGSPLRKGAKSLATTLAYYKGGAAGASLGTGMGAITGPGAVVTGTAGFIAGGELASNLTSKAFDKVWKPPTTATKTKDKNLVGGNTTGNKKKRRWKSGIAIESGG